MREQYMKQRVKLFNFECQFWKLNKKIKEKGELSMSNLWR